MINQNLSIDRKHNLIDDLRGIPADKLQITTRTIDRLCWRLTDRMAELLTDLADRSNVLLPTNILRDLHQVEIARFELHKAMRRMRNAGSR